MRSTADVLFSRISCSLPLGVHLSIRFGLISGFKFLGDAWSPQRQSAEAVALPCLDVEDDVQGPGCNLCFP